MLQSSFHFLLLLLLLLLMIVVRDCSSWKFERVSPQRGRGIRAVWWATFSYSSMLSGLQPVWVGCQDSGGGAR